MPLTASLTRDKQQSATTKYGRVRIEIHASYSGDGYSYCLWVYPPDSSLFSETHRSDVKYPDERQAHQDAHEALEQLGFGYHELDCPGYIDEYHRHWPCGARASQPLPDLTVKMELTHKDGSWRHRSRVSFKLGEDYRYISDFGSSGHRQGWRVHRDMHWYAGSIGAKIKSCDGYINKHGKVQPCPQFMFSEQASAYPLQCQVEFTELSFSTTVRAKAINLGSSDLEFDYSQSYSSDLVRHLGFDGIYKMVQSDLSVWPALQIVKVTGLD